MEFKTKFPYFWDQHGYTLENIAEQEDIRDDLRLIPLAMELGWIPVEGNTANHALSFRKGDKTVWASAWQGVHWQCADLILGCYRNHRSYARLETALRREA